MLSPPTLAGLVKIISKLLFLKRHHEWAANPRLTDTSPAAQMLSVRSSQIIAFMVS